VLAAVLVVGATYGQTRPAALVGQWVTLGGGKIELFADGTGVVNGGSITWSVQNNRFMMQAGGKGVVSDYKISGYELILTNDNNESETFVKKEKLEEYKEKEQQRIEKMSRYFIDSRDGKKYRKVRIGGKVWMAQNLNYEIDGSSCYNCNEYGRSYYWEDAMSACPLGWHLPSREEWEALVTASGGNVAGKALKSTSGWYKYGNGTDEFGFSAIAGGHIINNTVDYGKDGFWWTATEFEYEEGRAYCRYMYYVDRNVFSDIKDKFNKFSVRCVAD